MRRFDKIAIIGVGLIGGSIGLAIKKRRLTKEVVGIFRHLATLNKALKFKAIDRGAMDLKEGVKDADLILIATPVKSIPQIARDVIRYAKDGAIVTDVGSTKRWVVDRIDKMLRCRPTVFFIGSHPMAGSEHTSVEFARSDLFDGSPCIVTKTAKSDKKALNTVCDFWEALGAKVEVMSPAEHDRSVSLISHLAHIVAFSLASAVPQKELRYAAEGFKDTTRVASSDAELWADIFSTNRREILKACRLFERNLRRLTAILAKNRYEDLVEFLKDAKAKRDRLIYGKKG